MRFVFLICLIVAMWSCTMAEEQCNTICTYDYTPVCGEFDGIEQTFGNKCSLDVTKCSEKKAWTLKHEGQCVKAV